MCVPPAPSIMLVINAANARAQPTAEGPSALVCLVVVIHVCLFVLMFAYLYVLTIFLLSFSEGPSEPSGREPPPSSASPRS